MKISPIYKFGFSKQQITYTSSINKNGYFDTLKKERQALLDSLDEILVLPYEEIENHQQETEKSIQKFDLYRNLFEQRQAEILNGFNSNGTTKLQQEYFQKIKQNSNQTGFKRISGYDEVKERVHENFVNLIKLGYDAPNAIMFYGPSGCGKSTFAIAAAEEAGCLIETIEPDPFNPTSTIREIFKKANKAKENYENQNGKKTVLIIDDAETICPDDENSKEILIDFLQNCEKNYKCSVFLTVNNPKDMDVEYVSIYTTKRKIIIPPANRDSADQIIKDYLRKNNKPPIETKEILDELFSKKDTFYSNQDIFNILDLTFLKTENPQKDDYIETIKENQIPPSITPKHYNKFKRDESFLNMF